MERATKRSRSATRSSSKVGKRTHRAKSAAVSKHNRAVAKTSAARAIANAVTMGFMGIEKKFLDTSLGDTAIAVAAALTGGEYDPSAGCTGCLSCPAQGDTEQSRDGKRIVIDSLILKGFVRNAGTASDAVDLAGIKVFLAVVLDTQTNGAQLNSEDVFKNTANIDLTNCDPMKNLLFGSRFRILKSQTFDLEPIGVAPAGSIAHNGLRRDFDWYIPFKGGLAVNLNAGTTANVTNVIDNSLHVVAFSTLTGALIGYNARIRFQG